MTEYTDLCGCEWEEIKGIWVCTKRCEKHSKPKPKPEFRPKSECCRAGGKWD